MEVKGCVFRRSGRYRDFFCLGREYWLYGVGWRVSFVFRVMNFCGNGVRSIVVEVFFERSWCREILVIVFGSVVV